MGNAFGKTEKKKSGRAKPTLTEQDRAILDLKLARDGLKRYQQRTEKESTTLLTKAKLMYKAGDTKKAVYLMKVRKLKASKIDDLNAQLMTIERMVATIEWKTQSVQIFNAMQTANGALKSMQAILPIERVEALMDDVTDSVEYQQEIDEALSGQDIVIDDSQLNDELDRMAQEMGLSSLTTGAAPIELPKEPSQAPLILPEAPTLPVAPAGEAADPAPSETGRVLAPAT